MKFRFLTQRVLAVALLLCTPILVSAQTVLDPTTIEFDPSPDHFAINVDGSSVIDRYDVEYFMVGNSLPFQVLSVGKPAPGIDGKIHVTFMPSSSASGGPYEARVSAIGPLGSGESSPSNQFTYSGSCSYALSSGTVTSTAAAGSYAVNVLTAASCVWSPTSSASWLTVLTGTSTGPAALNFSVTANTNATARTAFVSVGSQSVAVTQAGTSACSPTASATSINAAVSGLTGSIPVLAGASCGWTAASAASWVTLSPASGSGPMSVAYTVTPNPNTTSRTTTLTVAGTLISVTQAGSACAPKATATPLSATYPGASGKIAVTAGTGCSWTAVSGANWVTLSPLSGSGSASVAFVIAPNTTTTPRSTSLTVAGTVISVTQTASASACAPKATGTALSATAPGASGSLAVTAGTGCAWTAVSGASWVTLSPASGSGSAGVAFTIAPNTTTAARSTSLTVAGTVISVTQTASACAPTATATALNATAPGASGTIPVTAGTGCSWTAVSGANWVTVSPASGSGSANVAYAITPNTTTTSRSTSLTVAGTVISVTQAGSSCAPTAGTTAINAIAPGTAGTIPVTAGTGCAWTATSAASWVTVSPASGSGSAAVAYVVTPNTATTSRSTSLKVAGTVISVTQAGVACAPTLSTTSGSVAAGGGSGQVGVTAASGCSWTAVPSEWIAVTPNGGTGSGSVTYTAKPNPFTVSRVGTFVVAGKTVTISQPAPATCQPTISKTALAMPSAGGTAVVDVQATSTCSWNSVSSVAWVGLSPSSGIGSKTVTLSVSANTTAGSRGAIVTIAGQPVSITQPAAQCAFTLSNSSVSFPSTGGTGSVSVTTMPGCAWTSKSSTFWIKVQSGQTGVGSGAASFKVSANRTGSMRTQTVTIAGQPVTVVQQ